MEIIVADNAGFCFGVKRAIRLAEENVPDSRLVCLGSLIHNQQEMDRLAALGVKTRELKDGSLSKSGDDTILIRSHGVGPAVYSALEKEGWRILDATCPYVHNAQKLAEKANAGGYQVIILGDKDHAEVQGLLAWTDNKAIVVKSWQELQNAGLPDKVAVLAQTTEKEEKFAELIKYLEARAAEVQVFQTICKATRDRQKSAAALAGIVDIMLVIGGRHSSNTQKLLDVCRAVNEQSYLVEEAGEINQQWFKNKNKVGITAGASTPEWIIKEVIKKLEENIEKQNESNESVTEVTAETGDTTAAETTTAKTTTAKTTTAETTTAETKRNDADSGEEQEIPDYEGKLNIRNLQPGDMINGRVVSVTEEGAMVDIGGKSEVILPAAEVSHRHIDPREILAVGQDILVEVIKEDDEGHFILSHKKALLDQSYEKLTDAIENGSVITAPVIEVVKGGLVVDVGIRGFVPASQVERAYVEDLSQFLHQELRMKVLEMDRENNRVVLSQRAVLEGEHQQKKAAAFAEITEGQKRKGIVSRLAKFGAFVDIGGIDGLLHISEMTWGRIEDPAEIVKVGDEIEVVVKKVDREKEKISLSLKALLKSPWDTGIEKFKPNMVVNGKVVRIAPFGAFIELEQGIEGLAHISQISQKRISKVEEVLSVGQQVDVKILEIEPAKKRISLSLKDIVTDLERTDFNTYQRRQDEDAAVTIGDLMKMRSENQRKK